MTNDLNSPVAILDKDLARYPSYTIETFELCDCCGARFAIGYHQECKKHTRRPAKKSADLPNKSPRNACRRPRPRSQA